MKKFILELHIFLMDGCERLVKSKNQNIEIIYYFYSINFKCVCLNKKSFFKILILKSFILKNNIQHS